jgi:hypothetical protein
VLNESSKINNIDSALTTKKKCRMNAFLLLRLKPILLEKASNFPPGRMEVPIHIYDEIKTAEFPFHPRRQDENSCKIPEELEEKLGRLTSIHF